MNEQNKASGEQWLAGQQAMWKAFLPTSTVSPAHESTSLEEQFNELRDTWQASVAKWTEFAKDATQGDIPTPAKLREMFAPASWTGPGSGVMDAALQRVLEGPRYATLWDHDRKLLGLQQLTAQRDKDVAAYQAVVQKAWSLAFERFVKGLNADPKVAAQRTWRGLVDQWLAAANDTLIEAHRSVEFIEAQRRMLRSASDCHLQERRIAEAWCEATHLPTRTEVDELQRHVTELRREVRLLRRAARAPEVASAAKPLARKTTQRRAGPTSKRDTRA